VLQLDSLETNLFVEYSLYSLKVALKGKSELGQKRASTAFRYQYILSQVRTYVLIALFLLFDILVSMYFGEAMGLKGPKVLLFWCLMPKGEKLRPKQMDQPTTCEFQKL
jgi:hypothetical protein